MPSCESPTISCQSITIDVCGFELPNLSAVPLGDFCKKYATYTYYYNTALEQIDLPLGGGVELDYLNEEEYTVVDAVTYVGLSCGYRNEGTTSLLTENTHQYNGGTDIINTSRVFSSYGDYDSPCDGTETYTDNVDPGNNYVDDWDVCSVTPVDASNAFSYAAGVFTYNSTEVIDAYTTRNTTITHSYTDEITPSWLKTKIESLSFDDANGDECSSSIEFDGLSCNSPIGATLARYRVGLPTNYSPLSAPRSVYEVTWDEVFVPELSSNPPVLVNARSWVWDGNTSNNASPFYTIPLPLSAGQTQLANFMVVCWKSAKIGYKPTSFEPIIEI